MKTKLTLTAFLTATILAALMVAALPFTLAQSGTNVSGMISQDATWTLSGSPYVLTGNTLVNQGITLTIRPGVTVNLGDYYIMVNGTLSAGGSNGNLIQFVRGSMTFTSFSSSLSLIDYANLTSTPLSINGTSPKISNSYTSSITVDGSSPIISNNHINDEINILDGSPSISGNQIKTTSKGMNDYPNPSTQPTIAIVINGSPTVSNNVITGGGVGTDSYGRQNGDLSAIQVNSGTPTISNNYITGEGQMAV